MHHLDGDQIRLPILDASYGDLARTRAKAKSERMERSFASKGKR